jgi:hypothetical protein
MAPAATSIPVAITASHTQSQERGATPATSAAAARTTVGVIS